MTLSFVHVPLQLVYRRRPYKGFETITQHRFQWAIYRVCRVCCGSVQTAFRPCKNGSAGRGRGLRRFTQPVCSICDVIQDKEDPGVRCASRFVTTHDVRHECIVHIVVCMFVQTVYIQAVCRFRRARSATHPPARPPTRPRT